MVAIKPSSQLKHEEEPVRYVISPWRKWFYISFAVVAYFLITITMFHSHKLMSHHEKQNLLLGSPGSLGLLQRGHGGHEGHGHHHSHSHHPHGHGHGQPHHHSDTNYQQSHPGDAPNHAAYSPHSHKSNDWDFLIFTQHWPNTVCMMWKEQSGHGCNFPADKDMWSIHGVWPTKTNTMGPFFCNSVNFNETLLEPIEDDLKKYWLDVEQGRKKNDLWIHEWRKHGTCALSDPPLDSELKYFSQGLKWFEQYNMEKILGQYSILPKAEEDSGVRVQDIWHAVKESTGKNPVIRCEKDPHNHKTYLFEIRLCFDKELNEIDCDGAKMSRREHDFVYGEDIHTNCPLNEPILYPSITQKEFSPNPVATATEDNSALSALKKVRSYIQGVFMEKDTDNSAFNL